MGVGCAKAGCECSKTAVDRYPCGYGVLENRDREEEVGGEVCVGTVDVGIMAGGREVQA